MNKITNVAPDHLRPARRALVNRCLASGHLPKAQNKFKPGLYPKPSICSTIATAALLLYGANYAELAAPTLDYAQAAHRAAMRPIFAPVDAQDPEFPEVLESTSSALLGDTQTPVDAQIHTCQLLAHGAAKHQLNVLRVFDDHKDAAQHVCTLEHRSSDSKVCVGHMRRLFTTAPGNPKWKRSDVPILLTQIKLLLESTPATLTKAQKRKRKSDHIDLYGMRSPALIIYLIELARAHLVLHAAGIEISANKFSFVQLYMISVSDDVMERHVLGTDASAGLASGPGKGKVSDESQLLCDALSDHDIDATALTHALIKKGVDMIGRRARRAMVDLLIQCCTPLGALTGGPRPRIFVAWDLDNIVPADKAQLAAFDKEPLETRLYALAYSVAAKTHEKLKGLKYIKPDLSYMNQKEIADYKVVLELVDRREKLRKQPAILVSGDGSFRLMESMVLQHGGCWAFCVHSANAAVVFGAWAQMCMGGLVADGE
ncbi:hypothetical protein H9P43_000208 [Blastocladiella emersonii ATCC 22665]|nr:hypothetical protein H9P43_000208 [Blastocladiella emersonii ATCC 22665]